MVPSRRVVTVTVRYGHCVTAVKSAMAGRLGLAARPPRGASRRRFQTVYLPVGIFTLPRRR
eukprot:193859-Hanusia_phi.AAC.1